MRLPVVAIVGRPNVGKSTLFNRLIGRRLAVVDDTPGVTRDRHAGLAEWAGRSFYVVDTGGWNPGAAEGMEALIAEQVRQALAECDAVLFLTDAREGLQPLDEEISRALHRLAGSARVLLLVNKADDERWETHAHEFEALGWTDALPLSAAQGRGIGEALDALLAALPPGGSLVEPDDGVRVAVLGRPNVGKSSLTNALLGRERMIVDPTPGTTRDAVDVPVRWHGKTFWLIDTAGLRHRLDRLPAFEFYASVRSIRALERSQVALFLLDATAGVTRQDQRIASLIEESGRSVMILVNKWDLVAKDDRTALEFEEQVREALSFLDYAPLLFVSALTAQRVSKIPERIFALWEAASGKAGTGALNALLARAVEQTPPRGGRGRPRPKLLYATQTGTAPPTFTLFARHPECVSAEYLRFLGRQIRERFDFSGTPIRFQVREATGRTPKRGGGGRRS
ncbi:MAG: ribosome biogenesis GTPase Der [Candidatus Eisenbacteria bacterium]|uniref:GTPase Der n=1 Tax=Eiseniibacteriota bacterium TaxID=2212470 RepID=A0A937XBZ4_UNCEI|nr:ribosome biogenesis GTPase Der [Candidatus Eisenbacteria bacterium]